MNQKLPKPQVISKKAVRELLQNPEWMEDIALTGKFEALKLDHKIYTHPDGNVLGIYSDGRAKLYLSSDDLAQWIEYLEALRKQPATHVLEGRLPQGQDFIEHVPQLIEAMAKLLKLTPEVLDGSVESLIKVDTAIKRYGKKKSLEVAVFPGLVAYVGETMRRDVNGKWEMRLNEHDKKTWEPWIVDPEGRYCNPFMAVYDELDDSHGFSIYGSTAVRLNMRRPFPPTPSPALIMTQTRPPES